MQDSLRNFKAEFFKALSHPVRIKIFELLRAGELSVTDLQDRLGIESSNVSQHLSGLRHKNIVESRKAGTPFIIGFAIQRSLNCLMLPAGSSTTNYWLRARLLKNWKMKMPEIPKILMQSALRQSACHK